MPLAAPSSNPARPPGRRFVAQRFRAIKAPARHPHGFAGCDPTGPSLYRLEGGFADSFRASMNDQTQIRDLSAAPAFGSLLFGKGDRHITAEVLFDEAMRSRIPVSLATVYNTLHQFTEAGLLRQLAVDGSKAYFDTNPSEHHHFF